VRQLEHRPAADEISGHQEVDVEVARPPSCLVRAVAPGGGLELQAPLEQLVRTQITLDEQGRIEE
jgi:hypothetical protein